MSEEVTNRQLYEVLCKINQNLEALVAQQRDEVQPHSKDNYLSAYPARFITPKEALPYLPHIRSVAGIYAACREGQFEPGTELLDMSPAGSERPTYLVNLQAYFKRLQKEQKSSLH